jgi:hypothetical protein
MSTFDFLTRGSIQVAPDGRRVFFPWGVIGRGYVISSEVNCERLRQHKAIGFLAGLALASGAVHFLGLLAGLIVVLAFTVVDYARWRYQFGTLQPPAERLSLRESFILQARARSAASLRLLIFFSIVFVAIGIAPLAIDPAGNWPRATLIIIAFAFLTVLGIVMAICKIGEAR